MSCQNVFLTMLMPVLCALFVPACSQKISIEPAIQQWQASVRNSGLLSYSVGDVSHGVMVRWQVGSTYHNEYTYFEMLKPLALQLLEETGKNVEFIIDHSGQALYTYKWSEDDIPVLRNEKESGWMFFVIEVINSMTIDDSIKLEAVYIVMMDKMNSNLPVSWWELYKDCIIVERDGTSNTHRLIEIFMVFCDYPEFNIKVPSILRSGCNGLTDTITTAPLSLANLATADLSVARLTSHPPATTPGTAAPAPGPGH